MPNLARSVTCSDGIFAKGLNSSISSQDTMRQKEGLLHTHKLTDFFSLYSESCFLHTTHFFFSVRFSFFLYLFLYRKHTQHNLFFCLLSICPTFKHHHFFIKRKKTYLKWYFLNISSNLVPVEYFRIFHGMFYGNFMEYSRTFLETYQIFLLE